MNQQIYNIFLELSGELKTILNESDITEDKRLKAVECLDKIKAEMDKPKTERDCYHVKKLMENLSGVKVLKPIIDDSKELVEKICFNK